MPIFVPSLRRADPARIAQMVTLCTQALRNSCLNNPEEGHLAGVFDNFEELPSIRDISYIFSAQEEEKMYRANPRNRPYKITKRTVYQEVGGKHFYCPEPVVIRHAEIKAFMAAMQPVIEGLGFSRYQLTPVAIQKAQRTVVPATKLVRTHVSDVVLGEMVYMIRVEVWWDTLPEFTEEEPAEEKNEE